MKKPVLIIPISSAVVIAGAILFFAFNSRNMSPTERHVLAKSHQAFDNNDLDGALAAAESVLSNNPNDIPALLAKASALAQRGSLEFKEKEYGPQAIEVARQVLALDPNNSEAWRLIGYAHEIMQEYPQAHEAYQKSLALDESNALTISQEAHAYDLQGQLDKAEEGYRAALSLDPSLEQANMGLGRILVQTDRAQDALAFFSNAAETARNIRIRAEALYSAGSILLSLNDIDGAQRHMRSAVEADSTYPLAWVGLGTVLFSESVAASTPVTKRAILLEESVSSLEHAISLNPSQTLAHYQLGVEIAALGKPELALKFLNEASTVVDRDITLSTIQKVAMRDSINTSLSFINNNNSI